MPVFQAGQINQTALQAPDLYVIIQPPSVAFINGVATDGLGLVGVGSWGPVNAPMMGVGNGAQAQQLIGPVTNRLHDIATAVAIGDLNNVQNYILVRVTDGTDTAASAQLKDTAGSPVTGMTLTGMYTGVVGNGITAAITAGTAANTYKLSVTRSGFTPEVFDNVGMGVSGGTVTPGTGYTSVPTLSLSAPQAANGVQAVGSISLKVLSAAVAAAGTGFQTGDTLTLPNGVLLTVTANAGAITALAVTNAGALTSGSVPANPVSPSATSGAGTGATVTLTWGLGAFTVSNAGNGYTSATATLTGGGATAPGSIALTVSVWLNLVNAVNNGQSGLRGPSQNVIATLGTSPNVPNLTATYQLSGGTDGAAGVSDNTLLGADGLVRSGMYALRKSGAQVGNLIDCTSQNTWSAQLAFGLQEGIYFHGANPAGTSITDSATNLANSGVDGYGFMCLVGDWTFFNDTVNGVQRMVSPATYTSALQAATSPEQSILNAPINGIIATQSSLQNLTYSDAEIAQCSTSRLDVVTLGAPAGSIFACRTGQNASSNSATNGDNYTRMTNYIAFTIASAFGYVPGKVQTINLRRNVKGAMDAFFANLQTNNMIGNVNAPTQPGWSVEIDAKNNPFSQVALGYMQALVKVTYLSIVRYFLVNIEGGQTVTVTPVQNP
ncbi:hypothetical protein [Paraburkholderia sp. SOS3]|uniref:hypothetical protein n=1 Tax=Paraburkholderia sp. SOS3 TaxID=1926494 RepID=UPI00094752A3|nr:hypothetical protein [Paraburkholderia sp. SOS3]APR40032.1 hypothetical protein BTO02_33365 [Paraburkholderia sp. SOS3]APR40503.1 hypothetical protein BTO02_33725 [Paraburkholderia sp. SOS3]